MDISFIWVNFHSGVALQRSLASLDDHFNRTGLEIEYIVVNNDIAERALIEGLRQDFPRLKTVHSSKNIGFGQANMLGSRIARGKTLFFINPDTVFLGGSLTSLLAAFEYRPKAIYGMALETPDGIREPWSAGIYPTLFSLFRANFGLYPRPLPWEARSVQAVGWVSGAALAIRKDFFQSLGGFDPRFFLYFEDVDLARRAKESGGYIGVYPFLRFLHAGGKSHKSIPAQKKYFHESQLRFFIKWRPWYESAPLLLAQKVLGYR